VVRRVSEEVFMPFTVGGGIRSLDDATRLIQAGAEKVSINSAAVRTPDLVSAVARKFGRCATVVNIHPRRVKKPGPSTSGEEWWEVHINGGRVPTGLEAVSWARRVEELGAGEIVLTSMDADGTKAGYDLPMTRAVSRTVRIPVVASGGAGSPEHLYQVLTEGGADAALAASIFHYNEYGIPATKRYLAERGVPVRL
jgi:imidazole glycerol-phosphate synthase subunit HisF